MELRKIKFEKNEIIIGLKERKDFIEKEIFYKSKELPHADFREAMQSLSLEIPYILDLEKEYIKNLEIKGISISDEGGVVISAQKKVSSSDAPFCLNTPYQPPCRNENQEKHITSSLLEKVEILTKEAFLYMKGKNAQETFSFMKEEK